MGRIFYQQVINLINCLLIFSLAHTPIMQSQLFKGLDQYYANSIAPLPGCLLTDPAANAAACSAMFQSNTNNLKSSTLQSKKLLGGPSENSFWKSAYTAVTHFFQSVIYSGSENDACNNAVNDFKEINNTCAPFLRSLPTTIIAKSTQDLYEFNKPLIDISCILTQLGAADSSDSKIFLPGCAPQSAGDNDQCLNSPMYWQAFDLLYSYSTGYVYKYPNPADGFSMLNYIATWITAQTHAQNNTNQAGQPITPQINIFDPNSFLDSTNNIQARVTADLNSALQTALNLFTSPANHFPSDNLAKLNHKTSVTCNPNLQCAPQDTSCIPCCEAPTMSLADAQAFLLNNLHDKLTELYNNQQQSSILKKFFRAGSGFTALERTQIPDLAIIDPVTILNQDTTTEVNGQPVPLSIGKTVTNWPDDPDFLQAAQSAYIQHSLFRAIADSPFKTQAGETFYCDPISLFDRFVNTTNICNLAAADLAVLNEFESILLSLAIFIVVFAATEGMAAGLAGSIDAGLGLTTVSEGVAQSAGFTLKVFTQYAFAVYGVAMNIPMLLALNPTAKNWFNDLPETARDAWAPPLGVTINNNILNLEENLSCELSEYMAEFSHTTAEPCRTSSYNPIDFG